MKSTVTYEIVLFIRELRLPDGSEDWDAEIPLVREVLGNKLDAVYSSEESYGENFSQAYPEAVNRLVDVKRINYPIISPQFFAYILSLGNEVKITGPDAIVEAMKAYVQEHILLKIRKQEELDCLHR